MKRGSSGLSLVVAIDKPTGMTSHDVVNRCRKVFGERRVGHTGTLDPLASGVLPVCVGPATRLGNYFTGNDKSYRVTIAFGYETATDDMQGERTAVGPVMPDLENGAFADDYVKGLIGTHMQVPPAYSAIKVKGKKAYEIARRGDEVELEPRQIEVIEARLVSREWAPDGECLNWIVDFVVSKGTYIRALARDIGRELGTPAHVAALQRLTSGSIALDDCVSLETLESLGTQALIDPVAVLGYRILFADGFKRIVETGGNVRRSEAELHELNADALREISPCTSTMTVSVEPPRDGELICVVVENRLKAIYAFDGAKDSYKPECVFSVPVQRFATAL